MMLCCLHDGFNGTVGLSLSQVFLESISEDGQLAIGLEATEGFLGLQQAGGGPSERHLGVSPAFDVAGDLAHRAERVLDDVGAGERAPEFVRQAEADDGEDLVQPLQDAARDARFLMLQTPGQVAQEPLGLVCVVLVPGLTERLLDARVQMLGQALDDVTALVDLAALDGGWTRLSCRRFDHNAVRLQLHALAYNLGNFMRTLALPDAVKQWSLTSLREKLIKIGAKIVRHGRYVTFQMAEVVIPRDLFADILRRIDRLRPPPAPA